MSRQSLCKSSDPNEASSGLGCDFDLLDSTRRLTPSSYITLQTHVAHGLAELLKRPDCLAIAGGSLRVKLIDDVQMAIAHERHSGILGPTDILTFDLRKNPNTPLDADLLIDIDVAARQAALRAHPLEAELLLYIIHGVLHCLGFDDHDEIRFQQMHAVEDQILTAIGVGAIFVRGTDQGARA